MIKSILRKMSQYNFFTTVLLNASSTNTFQVGTI